LNINELIEKLSIYNKSKNLVAALFLNSRLIGLLNGIKTLNLIGLEDASRILYRAFLETQLLFIVCLDDPDISKDLLSDSDKEGKEIWNKYIAYGKIYSRLEKSLKHIGWPDKEIKNFIANRKENMNICSDSVHYSNSSTFRSLFIPTPFDNELLYKSPLGFSSSHTHQLLNSVVNDVLVFSSIFIKFLMKNDREFVFSDDDLEEYFYTTAASYYVFQEIVDKYTY